MTLIQPAEEIIVHTLFAYMVDLKITYVNIGHDQQTRDNLWGGNNAEVHVLHDGRCR